MQIAARTIEYPFGKGHRLSMTATATGLAGIGWVYSNESSASFYRFAAQHTEKARPCCIGYRFGKAVVVKHAVYPQVLHKNTAVVVYDFSAVLVAEILTFKGNPFVSSGDSLPSESPLFRTFDFFGKSALYFSQSLFFLPEEAGILNFSTIRHRSKGLQPNVNANRFIQFWQTFGFYLGGKTDEPLPGGSTADSGCFRFTLYWSVQNDFDMPDFGYIELATFHFAPTGSLGEAETVVPVPTPKAGETGSFASLHPAKESLETQVNSDSHVLQDLRMDGIERGAFLLQGHEIGLLLIQGNTVTRFLIQSLAFFEQVIVEPTALIEGVIKQGSLLL